MVTLDQILRSDAGFRPSRQERYSLALVLASSVLQLLDTPWLPEPLKKTEVVFVADTAGKFHLEQPQVSRSFSQTTAGSVKSTFSQSLDNLGVVLLELCFGDVLENQPHRKNWRAGENDMERAAFDLMAARDWQREVTAEAGPDYSEAVAWCLGGNRSAPPDRWRQEMLRRVVRPLQRCRDYLSTA